MATRTFEGVNAYHAKSDAPRPGWDWLAAVSERFAIWRRRVRERETLAHLTGRDLADIGITRVEAEVEIAKPFWRA